MSRDPNPRNALLKRAEMRRSGRNASEILSSGSFQILMGKVNLRDCTPAVMLLGHLLG